MAILAAQYANETPVTVVYQLAEPIITNTTPTPPETYYPTTIIDTDSVNAKPTLDISVKIEE